MAMFQQYQGGIAPVQGISEAGARIGQMAQGGMVDFGKSLSEGIKAYNENSAKSEMANVKIQSLSQDIANKISMYSQDPEIAQSGILQGLMQKGQMLTEAPSKGLSQRLAIAHDAETSLAGFGQQLQEWSFLRGRAIERGIQEGLNKFKETKSITSPVFYDGSDPLLAVDPNQNIQQQKDRVLKRFRDIKTANPSIEGTEEQFWANWISNAEQRFAKGVDGVAPTVSSAQLEALQAERNILKSQSDVDRLDAGAIGGLIMNKDGLYEEQANVSVPVKEYDATMAKPADRPYELTAEAMKMLGYEDKKSNVPELTKKLAEEKKKLAELETASKGLTGSQKELESQRRLVDTISNALGSISPADTLRSATVKGYLSELKDRGEKITPELIDRVIKDSITDNTGLLAPMYGFSKLFNNQLIEGLKNPLAPIISPAKTYRERTQLNKAFTDAEVSQIDKKLAEAKGGDAGISPDSLQTQIEKSKKNIGTIQGKIKEETPVRLPSPKVALGSDVVVGSTTYERPVSVSERKAQVQDFLTERFGAIDPTDPTGKRRIPVQGFESFFAKAVPESEIKEFTTESGQKLIHLNGKWEMVKSAEPRSLQDIRKEMQGVYGKQTADGRLVPTEFIPESGIEIGGLYKGTDASEAQFNDEMTQLSDARRSIRRLQEINDSVGEFADLTKAGIAEVEVMNLKSALRKDIIGVGTVSNFEQSLIDKVIRNPTDFFSMESKDRAILLALAQRIDRRIKNIGAAKGLTVRIRDVDSGNRYEALRQQYLKAKGLI